MGRVLLAVVLALATGVFVWKALAPGTAHVAGATPRVERVRERAAEIEVEQQERLEETLRRGSADEQP